MESLNAKKANSIIGVRRGNAPVPLSILDAVLTGKGYTATEVLDASIKLARLADRRGFTRYWVAEHHAMPGVATSSPSILLSRLIGETKQIRLGSGGMMLPNFPPLVVAEQFGLLESLAPGRIDLGLGRAPGTNARTATALRRGTIGAEDFPEQLQELLHFLKDDFPGGHPYKNEVYAVPGPGQNRENNVSLAFQHPAVWLLGSSGYSARLAGQKGLPFAFAAQLALEHLMMALEIYRKSFQPSDVLESPYTIACFGVFAAEDSKEAYRQSRSFAFSMMRMMYGESYIIPSPDEMEAYPYDELELKTIESWHKKILHGTPDEVVQKLNKYQASANFDELMITSLGHSPAAIYRSTELIADAYGMPILSFNS